MTTGDNVSTSTGSRRASPAGPTALTAPTAPTDDMSQNQRDKRVAELWQRLAPAGVKELDLKGLQKGLRRIDHPMKNADEMLRQIIQIVDSNGDGKIQYEEFRVFVEAAEKQLLLVFQSIDRDHDGKLNKDELKAAFRKCNVNVPARRMNSFFDDVDMNHDGYISFDEWRDFLLFIPIKGTSSTLEDAFSYYASIVMLNAEGDSMVSDETLEGLGTTGFLLHALFGSIVKLAQPSVDSAQRAAGAEDENAEKEATSSLPQSTKSSRTIAKPPKPPRPPDEEVVAVATPTPPLPSPPSPVAVTTPPISPAAVTPDEEEVPLQVEADLEAGVEQDDDDATGTKLAEETEAQTESSTFKKLTQYLPHPGYFLAGALAGGISRTATAPFDRLKVFLLVNTRPGSHASIDAAKHGHPLGALHSASKPIGQAIMRLYKAGGLRTFFAGNGLNVIKIMPETAIKFGSYEAAKRTFAALEGHGDPSRINPYSKFVAGGVAGMIAQFCVYPLDTLKFRLQCETVAGGPTGHKLLVQTARKMYQTGGGVLAAYRGITMGLIGMFPYSAIDMGTFEFLKGAFTRYKARYYDLDEEDAKPGNVATGFIGATSGAFGATVVYPLNVLRTRLQTQGTAMHPATYTGIWDVAHRTLANEGPRGLYKGLTPNLLKVAPALSITWVVYENSKKFLGLP